jgi:hypothetical protein
MISRRDLKLQFANAGLVAALAIAGTAGAAMLPKEGTYDYIACNIGVTNRIDFSKTHWAYSYEQTGIVRSNPPGGLFDQSTSRCVGLFTSFEGKISSSSVCESLDTDGDKRLATFSRQGDKLVRTEITGTGKYDGMVSTGVGDVLPAFPEIKPGTYQNCNHQTGTYKMK